MPDFSHRSYQKELLDRDDIPFADIKRNMQELDFINRNLGGHKITLSGLKKLLDTIRKQDPISIVEIGCGGGDNLGVMKNFCKKKKIAATFTGIDINPHCIEFARSRKKNQGIDFICSDYRDVSLDQKPSIIFSSLFCHHFNDAEVQEIFRWMKENSTGGFFVNDLHRHPAAYYSIKWLAKIFSKSYLVKNDAPLSVLRGFKRNELENFCKQTSIAAEINWKWAFRWLIVYSHGR